VILLVREELIMTEGSTDVLGTLRDAVGQSTAARVFGTPVQHDGVLLLPVAKLGGGGGGGSGTGPAEAGRDAGGGGGGFGVTARPAGVFIVRGGHVSWRPAVDVNRIVLGGQVVAIVALLVVRSLIRARTRT
jgi:uncharacterized spore protein YtfJ